MSYIADDNRYDSGMKYRRLGNSGLLLPEISLGLWHNFGESDNYENCRDMLFTAFDLGITHFDLANNYGPPPGSAELTFGKILNNDLRKYRNEMLISTKAGYTMWNGPYGDWGSRKHLISSLDESLLRMQLDYVDIFYHHRPDPNTPLEETMSTLSHIVTSGKALYVGLSNYSSEDFSKAIKLLKTQGTPCVIEQSKYSMLNRLPEDSLLDTVHKEGLGFIAFSPLAQGLLTDKYLGGTIPDNSRAKHNRFLKESTITQEMVSLVTKLNEIAKSIDMTMAQLAVKWLMRSKKNLVTSVLIGASNSKQIKELASISSKPSLDTEILRKIENLL